MSTPNIIGARRVMPVAVFIWQVLVTLVSVAISGQWRRDEVKAGGVFFLETGDNIKKSL